MSRLRLLCWPLLLAVVAGCGNGGNAPGVLGPPPGSPSDDFNWTTQRTPVVNHLYGVFFADSLKGWAVGAGGTVLRTTDAGATWTRTFAPTLVTLHAVWFTGPDTGWAVGSSGTVLATADSGLTWTRIPVPSSAELNDVWFWHPDSGVVVGGLGTVLRTFDRGLHWAMTTAQTTVTLNSVVMQPHRGWAVGDGGLISGTTDRGVTWRRALPAVTAQQLNAVWAIGDVAWAVGELGTFTTTQDSTWEPPGSVGGAYQLNGLCFPTLTTGYTAGWNGRGAILHTGDGGQIWMLQDTPVDVRLNGVFFTDSLHGWAVGDRGVVLHTAHGGQR